MNKKFLYLIIFFIAYVPSENYAQNKVSATYLLKGEHVVGNQLGIEDESTIKVELGIEHRKINLSSVIQEEFVSQTIVQILNGTMTQIFDAVDSIKPSIGEAQTLQYEVTYTFKKRRLISSLTNTDALDAKDNEGNEVLEWSDWEEYTETASSQEFTFSIYAKPVGITEWTIPETPYTYIGRSDKKGSSDIWSDRPFDMSLS